MGKFAVADEGKSIAGGRVGSESGALVGIWHIILVSHAGARNHKI